MVGVNVSDNVGVSVTLGDAEVDLRDVTELEGDTLRDRSRVRDVEIVDEYVRERLAD